MDFADYRWQTHVFSGLTVDEATAAMQTWLGSDRLNTVKQPIVVSSRGALMMYISHFPMPDGHRIYLTAFMGVPA